jgi:hypothetical protein
VSERVLTLPELNRALLARQLLLERERMPVTRALERVAGLQAQWEPAPALALRTRLDGFDDAQLARALARRSVVRATLMRATIHLVTTRDYARFRPALEPMLDSKWRQYYPRDAEPPGLDGIVERVRAEAAAPRTAAEIQAMFDDDERRLTWFRVRHRVPFVRVDGKYVDARAWLGEEPAPAEDDLSHLVRRYLAAFGPASAADVAAWSGQRVADLRPALDTLPLRRFRDEGGRVLLDLPRAPLPPADTPAPPRLLPRFDNAILSHDDRSRIIAAEHRKRVVRAAEVDAVFLVDGFVAGRWKLVRGKLELDPFAPLRRADVRALENEATRLGARA